jgi:3-deoxy-D-manno-octulosonic-acid transferase
VTHLLAASGERNTMHAAAAAFAAAHRGATARTLAAIEGFVSGAGSAS